MFDHYPFVNSVATSLLDPNPSMLSEKLVTQPPSNPVKADFPLTAILFPKSAESASKSPSASPLHSIVHGSTAIHSHSPPQTHSNNNINTAQSPLPHAVHKPIFSPGPVETQHSSVTVSVFSPPSPAIITSSQSQSQSNNNHHTITTDSPQSHSQSSSSVQVSVNNDSNVSSPPSSPSTPANLPPPGSYTELQPTLPGSSTSTTTRKDSKTKSDSSPNVSSASSQHPSPPEQIMGSPRAETLSPNKDKEISEHKHPISPPATPKMLGHSKPLAHTTPSSIAPSPGLANNVPSSPLTPSLESKHNNNNNVNKSGEKDIPPDENLKARSKLPEVGPTVSLAELCPNYREKCSSNPCREALFACLSDPDERVAFFALAVLLAILKVIIISKVLKQ